MTTKLTRSTVAIATEMRRTQAEIENRKAKWVEEITALASLAMEQGRMVAEARAAIDGAMSLEDWLRMNVPALTPTDAAKFERIAKEQLTDPRQCVFAFLPKPEAKQLEAPRTPPDFWESFFGVAERLRRATRDNPVAGWPTEQQDIARQRLEPIVRELWPDGLPTR